ncbi:MAG: hypothetical protein ACOX8S_04075 [Christensenellales bacterium]|jgi:hypothetical protein
MKSEKLLRFFGNIEDKYIIEARPKATAETARIIRLFRRPTILVAAIIVFLLLCAFTVAMYFILNVSFPFSDKGKTEFNTAVYAIDPFTVSMELPNGWTLGERENPEAFNGNLALLGVWSIVDIYNENNECAGAMGYNIYELYEGAEDDPRAIYNQIALGNNYHFNVRDSYTVVRESDYGTTAIMDVYYSANINNGEEMNNRGIVTYNKDLLTYIAIEFASDMITDDQVENIARSLEFIQ